MSESDALGQVDGKPAVAAPPPPPPPPDDENPALIDAFKTFRWTVVGALGFGASALLIILSTRCG